MTIDSDIAVLERVPVLRRLGTDALRIIAIGAESYDVATGGILFTAGEIADGAYVIQRGSFKLSPERTGEDIVAGAGTLLGESALLAETRRPATATALEPSTVMRISRAMFLKMLESSPEAARRMQEAMATRADQWVRDIENVRAALARSTKPR